MKNYKLFFNKKGEDFSWLRSFIIGMAILIILLLAYRIAQGDLGYLVDLLKEKLHVQ